MAQGIIDFHTHAFPDALAARAVQHLEEEGGIKACLDGTVAGLLASMERHGVEKSVVCSIATKPSQFEAILAWSRSVRSERIVPLPSCHPADPEWDERIARVRDEGFLGLKMHPFYQEFDLDEERMFPLYEAVAAAGLLLVMHTGYDWAYPGLERAGPARIARVCERIPELRLVTTHVGAWKDWDAVEEYLVGKPIPMEISVSFEFMPEEQARRILLGHPKECILFGTDSPWSDQGDALAALRRLELGEERERLILRENAVRLLGG